jgi:predicted transcriptional regulator of viral defense system
VAKRAPKALFCLLTALRLHDLTTQAPHEVWIAIGNKAHPPAGNGDKYSAQNRDRIAKRMRPEQVEEAQALASGWMLGTPLPSTSTTGAR